MRLRDQIIKNLVELSHINFDKENILQESEYLGEPYQALAQDVADVLAYRWNRMTREDARFNIYQDRFTNLIEWVKKS
jgi:hypothetical protein